MLKKSSGKNSEPKKKKNPKTPDDLKSYIDDTLHSLRHAAEGVTKQKAGRIGLSLCVSYTTTKKPPFVLVKSVSINGFNGEGLVFEFIEIGGNFPISGPLKTVSKQISKLFEEVNEAVIRMGAEIKKE